MGRGSTGDPREHLITRAQPVRTLRVSEQWETLGPGLNFRIEGRMAWVRLDRTPDGVMLFDHEARPGQACAVLWDDIGSGCCVQGGCTLETLALCPEIEAGVAAVAADPIARSHTRVADIWSSSVNDHNFGTAIHLLDGRPIVQRADLDEKIAVDAEGRCGRCGLPGCAFARMAARFMVERPIDTRDLVLAPTVWRDSRVTLSGVRAGTTDRVGFVRTLNIGEQHLSLHAGTVRDAQHGVASYIALYLDPLTSTGGDTWGAALFDTDIAGACREHGAADCWHQRAMDLHAPELRAPDILAAGAMLRRRMLADCPGDFERREQQCQRCACGRSEHDESLAGRDLGPVPALPAEWVPSR